MNKIGNKELARALADKFNLDRASAEKFVGLMFDVVMDGLKYDKQTKVKGLGTFKVTSVAPRKSVDVNTGDPIVIEGRDKINFTADTPLRDRVNRPFSQFETVVVNEGVDFDEIDQEFADGMREKEETDEQETKADAAGKTARAAETLASGESAGASGREGNDNAAGPETTEVVEDEDRASLMVTADQLAFLNEKGVGAAGAHAKERPEDDSAAADAADRKDDVAAETAGGSADATAKTETVLTLSSAQLSVLNGRRGSEDSVSTRDSEEEAATAGAPATEQGLRPAEATEAAEAGLAGPARDDDALGMAENDLEEIKNYTIDLKEEIEHQHRNVRILMTVCMLLLLVCAGGIAYMASQLHKRNNRIAHLEAALVSVKYPKTTAAETSNGNNDSVASPVRGDETTPTAEPTASAKEQDAAKSAARQEAGQRGLAAENQATTETKRKAEGAKASEAKQAAETKPTAAERAKAARMDKYNRDVRIRTGAYRIVGIDRTLTVRAGQTLTSISRAALGPGMECYIEAVNDGRTEFKAGEKINIPKLKLKKK